MRAAAYRSPPGKSSIDEGLRPSSPSGKARRTIGQRGVSPLAPLASLGRALRARRLSSHVPVQRAVPLVADFGYTMRMARITVEDCLERVPNRFELVLLAARRAKQLLKGARPLVESDNKEVVTSLREIAAEKVELRYAE